jgi:hypothetical protein
MRRSGMMEREIKKKKEKSRKERCEKGIGERQRQIKERGGESACVSACK